MAQRKIAVWLYTVASVLCVVSAVMPVFAGGRLNVVLLVCGVVFVIIAANMRRKTSPGT